MTDSVVGASFRDPAGFVFRFEAGLYRQVNRAGAADYDTLMESGLYTRLAERGALVSHEEVSPPVEPGPDHYRTLRPELVNFVSYPYEWCFGQLRDAALATLRIQREALALGMSLKDASAYNIQFHKGRPVLIDTLSFERYREGEPWVAYRQFCQHFLAPLALMSARDVRLSQLLRVHIDGIPLDLAVSLLPGRSFLRPTLLLNLRLHARSQKRHESDGEKAARAAPRISKKGLVNVVKSLEAGVAKLGWEPGTSEWSNYEAAESYESEGLSHKREIVRHFLATQEPKRVWDLGANTGDFSRLACDLGAEVVAFDVDPGAVERNYRRVRKRGEESMLPLWLDLTNPSPALGWAHQERASLVERGRPDVVMALALIHHLAISNNLPLDRISGFLASLSDHLVIEFVPKSDPKVETLLATRADIFPHYTREGFESAFSKDWKIEEAAEITFSDRVLYRLSLRSV